jgi:hypothetical protein
MVSDRMSASWEGSLEIGGRLQLTAALSDRTASSIIDCQWTAPDGKRFGVDDEDVVSDQGLGHRYIDICRYIDTVTSL